MNRQDPSPTPDSLLIHRDFIRGIARGILGDNHLAEDVAQDTLVAGLNAAPAARNRRWLGVVARNLARSKLSGDANRRARERAQPERVAAPSPAEVAEREATRRVVVDAVLDLPPLYRSVVLLRFYEERTSDEIGRDLDLPAATVRTRLSRGLAMLREKLRAEYGDRAAWVAAVLPLAAVRGSGAVAAGTAGAAPVGIGVAWTKLMVAATALLALSSIWWFPWRSLFAPPRIAPITPVTQEAATRAGAPSRDDAPPTNEPAGERVSVPTPAPAAATARGLRGRVTTGAGQPAVGATVFAVHLNANPFGTMKERAAVAARAGVVRARVDATGAFTIPKDDDGLYVVGTIGDEHTAFSVQRVVARGDAFIALAEGLSDHLASRDARRLSIVTDDRPLALAARPGVLVEGTVETTARKPVPAAEVGAMVALDTRATAIASRLVALLWPVVPKSRTDANGRFRLRGLTGDCMIHARADGLRPGKTALTLPADPPQTARAVVRLAAWPRLVTTIRVEDAYGRAIPTARAAFVRPARTWTRSTADAQAPAIVHRADARGAIHIDCALPGGGTWSTSRPIADVRVDADGFAPSTFRSNALTPQQRVVLHSAASLTGVVRRAATGTPLGDVRVVCRGPAFEAETHTGSDGRYAFAGIPASRLTIEAGDATARTQRDVDPRTTPRLDLRLDAPSRTVSGVVVNADGGALPPALDVDGTKYLYLSLYAFGFDPTPLVPHGLGVDAAWLTDGRMVHVWGAKPFRVTAPKRWHRDTMWFVLMAPGHDPIVRSARHGTASLEIPVSLARAKRALARIEVRVTDARGNSSVDAEINVRAAQGGARMLVPLNTRNGIARGAVPPGKPIDLVVQAAGFASTVVQDVTSQPGTVTRRDVRLVPEVALNVTAVRPAGSADTIHYTVLDEDGHVVRDATTGDASFAVPGLGAARYRLVLTGRFLGAVLDVDLRDGTGQRHEVRLAPCALVGFSPGHPHTDRPGLFTVEVRDARGRLLMRGRRTRRGAADGALVDVGHFAPGHYTATFAGPALPKTDHAFEVRPETCGKTFTVTLGSP